MNSFIVGIIAGAFGVGYFIYGKRQTKVAPMLAGVLLCIYPYFTGGTPHETHMDDHWR